MFKKFFMGGVLLFAVMVFAGLWFYIAGASAKGKVLKATYVGDIFKETRNNTNFRKVLFTGDKNQLVVMSIPQGGEIGQETHKHVDQTLFFLSGNGKAIIDGVEYPVGKGDVVVVTPGHTHNFVNVGKRPLKIFTIYAPPNHIDGRIHATKAEADADVADEKFGSKVR